ncbi:MAG: hypothetical protein HON48_14280 [Desulfobacula sp.]|nr:hypothetical protein [Desulfobacula sp.]
MAWKAITAKELVAGTNSLKIWSTGGVSGTIKKIRVYTSEEAGLLNQSFNSDGSLSTNAQSPAISNQQSTPIIRAITAEQATLTEVKARAYADGMVTEAEARAIEAAQAKADLAEITASAYADGIVTAEEARAIADAQAKADAAQAAAEVTAAADATSKADAAEAAANAYAVAQDVLEQTRADAYADGIVSDEEARAIADAQAKADAAQAAAEVTAAADAMKVYDLTASHVVPLSTDINGADEWEFSVDEIFCDGSLVFVEYEGDGVLEIALNDSHLTVERIVNTSDYGDIDTGFVFSDEPEVEYIDLAMANGTGSYEYGGL